MELVRWEAANTITMNKVICKIFWFKEDVKLLPDAATASLPTTVDGTALAAWDAGKYVCFDTTVSKLKVWDWDSWEVVAVVS